MGQGTLSASGQGDLAANQDFVSAHKALTADKSVQFNFTAPDPPPQPPQWLKDFLEWLRDATKPVARFFDWIGQYMPDAPIARFLLWTVLALAAAALLYLIFLRLREGEWRLTRRKGAAAEHIAVEEEEWRPEAVAARSWLEEAEALAAQGRFAEAIHHLLLRSIDDIANRRPRLVRPALTSRELAASDGIPAKARKLFAQIARQVEGTLFGGRPVDRPDWEQARTAYAEFALPQAWRA